MDKQDLTGGRPRLVAAIPCYNEARHIESVVARTRKHVDLVLVVDDGSTDNTAELAEGAGALVIRHARNLGKGMAMNTALARARELGAEALVLLDGDGQHDPDEIPRVLQPVLSGEADVAIGSRFLQGARDMPPYRILGLKALNLVANLGSGMKLTDTQCGFRACSSQAIAALHFNHGYLGAVESEMQFMAKREGFKVVEVPITAIYEERAKRNPVVQGFKTLWATLRLALHYRPALFVPLAGCALLGLGAVGIIAATVGRIMGGNLAIPWLGAVSAFLVLAGALSVAAGLAPDLLRRRRR